MHGHERGGEVGDDNDQLHAWVHAIKRENEEGVSRPRE